MSRRRMKRVFEESFKLEVVQLYSNGVPSSEHVTIWYYPSALDNWIMHFDTNQSINQDYYLTSQDKAIIEL